MLRLRQPQLRSKSTTQQINKRKLGCPNLVTFRISYFRTLFYRGSAIADGRYPFLFDEHCIPKRKKAVMFVFSLIVSP